MIDTRLLALARQLVGARESDVALRCAATTACAITGHPRSLILVLDRAESVVQARAGHGVTGRTVAAVRGRLSSYPVVDTLLEETGPVSVPVGTPLLPAEQATACGMTGPVVAQALRSEQTGPVGLLILFGAPPDGPPQSGVRTALQELGELTAMACENLLDIERSGLSRTATARRQISADLHDGVIQNLFAVALDLDELRAGSALDPGSAAAVERIRGRVVESSALLRATVRRLAEGWQPGPELHDGDFGSEGVLEAVRDAAELGGRADTLEVRVVVRGFGPPPSSSAVGLLLRLVREGLVNTAKHADAARAEVVVRRSTSWWTLEVADDGTGDMREVRRALRRRSSDRGFGLSSLAAEAVRNGGRLWVDRDRRLGGILVGVAVPTVTDPQAEPAARA